MAQEIIEHIEYIKQRVARMDKCLLDGLRTWQQQLNLLQTVPGIDIQGAAILLVEIDTDMSVFGSTERLASWVGICPGNNESARSPVQKPVQRDIALALSKRLLALWCTKSG